MFEVKQEYDEVIKEIERLEGILADEAQQRTIIKDELRDIKDRYGDERRTEINFSEGEINIEDMIPNDDVVITISHLGYIKRTKVSEYRLQGRGGRGARGSKTRDEDFIEHMFVANNHNYLLLYTKAGKCFWLRVYEIPEASKTSTGRAIQNLLSLPPEDKVKAYIKITDLKDKEFLNAHYIMFCTKRGVIKKTSVEAFSRPRVNGINAITINEGDELLEVKLTNGNNEVLLANKYGRAIRFNEAKVRAMGRTAAGVKGMTLDGPEDAVVGMVCVDPFENDETILVVSEKGNGKRSNLEDYRLTNRGGKGVKTMNVTDKTGSVVALKGVKETDELMITGMSGIVIRMPVNDMRIMGRATQGVRVINLTEGDQIADVAVVRIEENGDEEE